jgi:ABC-type nitrate/sulfonate/bicarbonate transport system substrate-binding protein
MNLTRKIAAGFTVALVSLLVTGFSGSTNAQLATPGKPETTSFPVATVNDATYGSSVGLALENGYFKDEGLTVDLKIFATGVAQKEPLVAGQVPIGIASEQVWMTMRAAGAPISIIAKSGDLAETHQLIVSSKIEQPKDLEGKKIGYLKGSSLDAFYRGFCKEYGVDTTKVEALHMSQPEMVVTLLQGHVDAIFISGIFGPDAVKKGAAVGARLMHTAETSWITGKPVKKHLIPVTIVLMANDDFARKNPNTVAAFLRAVERATDDIRNNQQKAAQAIAKQTKIPLQDVLDSWKLASYRLSITPDLLKDLETDKIFLTSAGSIRGDVDIKAGINEGPLKAVLPQSVTWNR